MEQTIEAYSLEAASRQLPLETKAREVLYTIENSTITLLVGETGSGKSTKLPELLLKQNIYTNNGKVIAITLPRRISVLNICERLAKNIGTTMG